MGFGFLYNHSYSYQSGYSDGRNGRKSENFFVWGSDNNNAYRSGYNDGAQKSREREMFNWKASDQVEQKVEKDANPIYLILFYIFMFFSILFTVGTS